MSVAAIQKLHAADAGAVNNFFDNCRSVVGGRNTISGVNFRQIQKANRRAIYRSYTKFEDDLNIGAIPSGVKFVVYNPEPGFADTPKLEKKYPVQYGLRFAKLARKNNLISVAAPSCRLIRGNYPLREKFTRCGIEILAPLAIEFDFIDIQAQAFQTNHLNYRSVVLELKNIIKENNSSVRVVAQLSTADNVGGNVSNISKAAQSVANDVDGYWFNIEPNESGVSDALALIRSTLRDLDRSAME